ncbi:MAG: LLM class flavin-dependent oxidoreductase [Acidimicrobiales bacterium]|jgi:alkanesulfonate monooxygenase SsuD/methylene tetrahydromethanopterin reductase-like flavin-dependent oxidoreductase (luciferase family)
MLNPSFDIGLMFSFRNPAQWRVPFPELYRDHIDLAVRAEELGYDTIWLTEHHFADDGYSPSLIPLAAAIAARTERVRIGFNLLLLPLHNPVALAEDIAALDILSNGRIDLGVGQGYAVHEFAGYGIDLAERLGRFREGLDVLSGLFTNDVFSYEGTHYQIENARLSPRPVQQPSPPLWIGATSEPGVRRAGKRGAHLLGLSNPHLQRVYETARTEAGLSVDSASVAQLHWAHVADTDDVAWEQAAPHFHHLISVYGGWIAEASDPGNSVPSLEIPPVDELRTSPPVIFDSTFGAPETVTAKLNRSIAKIKTTHLCLGLLPGMAPPIIANHIERFATEVAPNLG